LRVIIAGTEQLITHNNVTAKIAKNTQGNAKRGPFNFAVFLCASSAGFAFKLFFQKILLLQIVCTIREQRAANSAWLLNLTAKNAMARRETQRGNKSYFASYLRLLRELCV
jgi:cell division protein FtsB